MSKHVPTHNFSKDELKALELSFKTIDVDHNGYLSPEELHTFMERNNLPTQFLKAIYKLFDKNNDNSLSFPEFCEYLNICMKSASEPRLLFKMIFDSIDLNHNGSLDVKEMMLFGDLVNIPMTKEQAAAELKQLDTDNNGRLEFDELCRAFGI